MDVPHQYGPSTVGHGEAQCKWCHGTNRENAIISPNHCEVRAEREQQSRHGSSRERVTEAGLRHALRKASGKFDWLAEHHVSSDYAKQVCKELAHEMWNIQSGAQSPDETAAPLNDAAVLELHCLLQEAVTLAELGDIDEETEAHGWGAWLKQARSVLRAAAPACDECKGAGEIVFNDHGGDPEWDRSEPCRECDGTGRARFAVKSSVPISAPSVAGESSTEPSSSHEGSGPAAGGADPYSDLPVEQS